MTTRKSFLVWICWQFYSSEENAPSIKYRISSMFLRWFWQRSTSMIQKSFYKILSNQASAQRRVILQAEVTLLPIVGYVVAIQWDVSGTYWCASPCLNHVLLWAARSSSFLSFSIYRRKDIWRIEFGQLCIDLKVHWVWLESVRFSAEEIDEGEHISFVPWRFSLWSASSRHS